MGKHLNPGNDGFKEVLNSHYVDKTGLIAVVNDTIGTTKKLTCISRPRRNPARKTRKRVLTMKVKSYV